MAVPDHGVHAPAFAHSMMRSIPGTIGLPVIFRRFLSWLGILRPWDARRGQRPHAMSLRPLTLYRGVIARCGFGGLAFDSMRATVAARRRCLLRCPQPGSGVNRGYPKITNWNNGLRGSLDHKRVLFVQHPLEKGRSRVAGSGSFVACAEVLGNCDRATEGGIPRSSRFRWFA